MSEFVYPVILIASVFVFLMGVVGLLMHRSPVRMLLSLEVSFNGILLLLLYLGWVLGNPVGGSELAIFAIAVSSSELAVIISVIMALFREGHLKVMSQDELKQGDDQ